MVLWQADEKKSYLTAELHILFPETIQFVNKCNSSPNTNATNIVVYDAQCSVGCGNAQPGVSNLQ